MNQSARKLNKTKQRFLFGRTYIYYEVEKMEEFNGIALKQSNRKEKEETLEKLGFGELLSDEMEYIEDEKARELIEKHDENCSYNECPLDLMTFFKTEDGRVIFNTARASVPGDPSHNCYLKRADREYIYAHLPPVLQELLPNKGLTRAELEGKRKRDISGKFAKQ